LGQVHKAKKQLNGPDLAGKDFIEYFKLIASFMPYSLVRDKNNT